MMLFTSSSQELINPLIQALRKGRGKSIISFRNALGGNDPVMAEDGAGTHLKKANQPRIRRPSYLSASRGGFQGNTASLVHQRQVNAGIDTQVASSLISQRRGQES